MHYELIVAIVILASLFLLGLEYLWLYSMAGRQERHKEKIEELTAKIRRLVNGILYSPTRTVREKQSKDLKTLVGEDREILDILCGEVDRIKAKDGDRIPDFDNAIEDIYKIVNPIQIYSDILLHGSKFDRGYACLRLADFDNHDYVKDIWQVAVPSSEYRFDDEEPPKEDEETEEKKKKDKKKKRYKNRDKREIAYCAGMALATLGEEKPVYEYMLSIQSDFRYSNRVYNEIFDRYTGDRESLAHRLLDYGNEFASQKNQKEKKGKDQEDPKTNYLMQTVVKAVTKYKIKSLEEMYKEGTVSKDINYRIACVKALGALGNPANEHTLIVSSRDSDWVVRSAAIQGLGLLRSEEAVQAVKTALSDKEWWVRQTAAKAFIAMEVSTEELADVIYGYDRYATDALKYALYRTVDIRN